MKKIILMLVAFLCMAFSPVETCLHHDDYEYQILLLDTVYYEDEIFGLFFDTEKNICFVVISDENIPNPYELMEKYNILDFHDAEEIFPILIGCEWCYGYQT
jgi:hypothetical protein